MVSAKIWLANPAGRGAVLPQGFNDFVDLVLPILKERGLFRTEYEANTLRGNLGLPLPENRYTAARQI